jgi:hypothetical protein
VPGLSSTTAAGVACRITGERWKAVEHGVAALTARLTPYRRSRRPGIPVGTVKPRAYYALRALRLVLAEHGASA